MKEMFTKEYIEFLEKNKLLPINETAKMLNLHPATLRSFAKSDTIKHVRIGKKYYFNLEDIKNSKVEETILPKGVIINNGYIKIHVGKDNNLADANGYALLHKMILESHLGRKLLENESVKHKNGITLDNRLENLEVV
jgi:hypothetical protein